MILYRGAKAGLNKMCGGSFYSELEEIANSYAELEDNGTIYEYNLELKLMKAPDYLWATDIDEGIETIKETMEDENEFNKCFKNYDGIVAQKGSQVILFGTIENNTFTKQSLPELMNDVNANYRRYGR